MRIALPQSVPQHHQTIMADEQLLITLHRPSVPEQTVQVPAADPEILQLLAQRHQLRLVDAGHHRVNADRDPFTDQKREVSVDRTKHIFRDAAPRTQAAFCRRIG